MVEINPEKYPIARRDTSIFDEFGIEKQKIFDPYRWMEDPDAEETQDFVTKLNELSQPILEGCPMRSLISEKLTQLWNFEKYGCPSLHGNFYYYYYNTGLQNQSVLFQQKTLDEKGIVFLDPNGLSADGTTFIRGSKFSRDGKIFAYGLSEKGSDWTTIKFRSCDGTDLSDVIPNVKFSGFSWTKANDGLFYSKYPSQEKDGDGKNPDKHEYHSLYFHKLATDSSNDLLVADFREDPNYMVDGGVTQDGIYLVVEVCKGCDPFNRLYYYDMEANGQSITGKLELTPLFDKSDAKYDFIDSDYEKKEALILTNYEAPMFKLVRIKLDAGPNQNSNWETVIDEDPKRKIEWVTPADGDKLLVCFLEDVKTTVYVYDAKSGRELYRLPLGIGSVGSVFCKKFKSILFISFESHLTPSVIYYGDFANCKTKEDPIVLKEIRRTKIEGLNPDEFVSEQLFYESKDKTKIPMYVIHAKDIKLDGNNPTILNGYGGFNISILPYFSISNYLLMKHFKMVIAFPTLRGGGEYGEKWHEAGMRERKQNVFDDFIYAARYLIDSGYTNSKRLAIQGGSNGGLLVAACSQQDPQLFGAVISRVGVMDMLRFHKFTIGPAWIPEFGDPDVPEDFNFIKKYSPLHNITFENLKPGQQWPPTLLCTADHDDRVVPSHTLKYIAELYHKLQENSIKNWQRNPLIARIDVRAGHGEGKPTAKVIAELVDVYSFLQRIFGMHWFD